MPTFIDVVTQGLTYTVELGLIVLSFSLTYRAIGFINFAHVEFATFGAAFALELAYRTSLWFSILGAMILVGILAVLVDLLIFRRVRNASLASKMIISAGLGLLMQAVIQFIWGVNPRIFPVGQSGTTIGGASVQYMSIAIVVIGVVVILGFRELMARSKIGWLIRAAADNPDLLEARGANGARVVTGVWFLSGALAALGGALLGVESDVGPLLGQSILIPMFAAAVLGGMGSAAGAIVGAAVLSFSQAILFAVNYGFLFGKSSAYLPAGYQVAFEFVVLLVFLSVRPSGLIRTLAERL